jgi:Helicase associated domain
MRRERSIAMMTGLAVVAIRPVAFIQRSLLVIFLLISCYPSDGLLHQHHHQSTFNVGRKVVVSETITPKRSSVFRAKRADNNENNHKEDSSMPPAPSSMSWNEHFLQLVEFGKEHGHVRVPKRHPRGLGEWVSRQRQRKSRLHAAQIQLLDSIGFCWNASGDKQQKETEQWWQRLESVRQQVQQSPIKSLEECLTPSQLIWLRRQRNEYVDFYQLHYTKNCKLSEQQIEALNEVDPSWWKTASERKWDLHFEALQLYYKEHGEWG